ncbi:DUF1351 domain-containing protein [Flavobacterium sp.]|uniref:DUF1351 domain-containing protein n=1 Tax=Flavobacterium sp. TaxID=239 RepID=UPI0025C4F6DD|nr:DUF1351 domain-containing protein [Flavobacterium sp.]MBA4155046.1 hypothetical protein [Flavobacterium sp.]
MENSLETFVIEEKDLELVISEQKLGALTTNAKEIKSLVEKILPNYDIANYNESNIDVAKKDKATLNKASKVLNDKRIELEKEFMEPFSEFKEIINDTCKLIKTATDKIDSVVKESEAKEKESKKIEIGKFWDAQDFNLVSIYKIFDEKWLNKTAKMKDVQKEILEKISKIKDYIITIEAIGSDIDLLKSLYLDTLNLNSTIQYANTLKQNRETAQKEAEARAKEVAPVEAVAKMEVVVDDNPFEEAKTEPQAVSTEATVVSTEPKKELLTRTMKVIGTYAQLVALGNFMNDNGITFEKIENGTV